MFVSAYVVSVIAIAFMHACVYDYESARHGVWRLKMGTVSEGGSIAKAGADETESQAESLTDEQNSALHEFLTDYCNFNPDVDWRTYRDNSGWTVLHHLAEALREAEDKFGCIPYMYIIKQAAGLVNAMTDCTKAPKSATALLMLASLSNRPPLRTAMVKEMLNNGANFNLRDQAGSTVLMRAVAHGLPDMAVCLLKKNADIMDKNFKGKSVLQIAKGSKCLECIEVLQDFISQQKLTMQRERSRSRGREPQKRASSWQGWGSSSASEWWKGKGAGKEEQRRGREPQKRSFTPAPETAPETASGATSSTPERAKLIQRAAQRQVQSTLLKPSWVPRLWQKDVGVGPQMQGRAPQGYKQVDAIHEAAMRNDGQH